MNRISKKHQIIALKILVLNLLIQTIFFGAKITYAADQYCDIDIISNINVGCFDTQEACDLKLKTYYFTGKSHVCKTVSQITQDTQNTGDQTTPKGYTLLAPIPTITGSTQPDLVTYMKGLFTLFVGLSIVFAVFQLVIGGIQYTLAAIPSVKSSAKGKMNNAVLGLFIVLISSILLNTLNPGLLRIGLNLDVIQFDPIENDAPDPITDSTPEPTGTTPPSGVNGTFTKQSDVTNRPILTSSGVTFNPVVRNRVVSTEGMRDTTVSAVVNLKTGCPSCEVRIASGTDGKHSTTGQYSHINGYKVDLQQTPSLTAYIQANTTDTGRIRSTDGARLYKGSNGVEYWKENTIWDIVVKPQ